jgi:lysophospholipase L1-like esterase
VSQFPCFCDGAIADQSESLCFALFQDLGVHLLDLYSHMETLPNWRALLCDGLHLSGEGQKELANQLMKLIRTQMPELAPNEDDSGLARDAPHHSKFAE